MEKNKHSAEKQLLKVLEEGSGKAGKKAKVKSLNSGEVKSRFLFFSDNFKKRIKEKFISPQGDLNFRAVQSLLKGVVFLFLLFYLASAAKGFNRLSYIPVFSGSEAERPESGLGPAGDLVRNFAHYGNILLNENIFMPRAEEEEETEEEEVVEASRLRQLTNNLKIAGISWDEDTRQRYAITEDIEKDVTYFLQEGDMILDLTVEQILKNKVILRYQNQQITLR